MAMLTRYDPFRELFRLQDVLARGLDDRLGVTTNGESVGWAPACDIFEDGDGVTVRFELAGVDPKDERRLENEGKRDGYHRVELQYGAFSRSFSLPGTVDVEKIRAESKNGLLIVSLPKKAEAKPRPIQVKVS
jgi:HSP20 family protein